MNNREPREEQKSEAREARCVARRGDEDVIYGQNTLNIYVFKLDTRIRTHRELET